MSLLSPVGNFFAGTVDPFDGRSFYYKARPAIPFGMSTLGTYASDYYMKGLGLLYKTIRDDINKTHQTKFRPFEEVKPLVIKDAVATTKAPILTLSVYLWSDAYIKQNEGAAYIEFPAYLTGLEMGSTARLKGLDIVGRNLQNYHYGGGEGTLRFTVQWRLGATETIFELSKKLEALSMSSGYGKGFPVLTLKLGPEESNPFKDQYYIMEKSTFIPGPIVQGVMRNNVSDGKTQPIFADQQLDFKRISPDQVDNHIWVS